MAARTEVGLVRRRNEDDLLVDEQHRLFLVADGLGGHAAGDVASRLAVRAVQDAVAAGVLDGAEPSQALNEVLHTANNAVLAGVAEDPARSGMGTTAVLAHLSEDERTLWTAHVGDSRAYLVRAGRLRQLTTDHTVGGWVGRSLTQALGTSGDVAPDLGHLDLDRGDRILLCTDGLTDMVDEDGILARLTFDQPPERICDLLVEDAISHGGVDNVTVIVIEVDR